VADDTNRVISDFYNYLTTFTGSWILEEGLPTNSTLSEVADSQTVSCAIRANCNTVFPQMREWKDGWEAVEEEADIFIISGYCLGYSNGQFTEGEWYFNLKAEEVQNRVKAKSYTARELYDFMNALRRYSPKTNGLFPNDGTVEVDETSVIFVWEPMELADKYSLLVSERSDLGIPILYETISSQTLSIHAYECVGLLEAGKTYYWQAIGFEKSIGTYAIGYTPVREFSTRSP